MTEAECELLVMKRGSNFLVTKKQLNCNYFLYYKSLNCYLKIIKTENTNDYRK